jgi:hypothetical protein
MNAKITENLEGENKAERFTLLEPPAYPDRPSKPDRIKILLLGVFAAFGGSGGLVFLLETLNQRIRGQEALAIAIRQRPMLVIPYIVIEDEVLGRKRLLKKVAIVVAAACRDLRPPVASAVHAAGHSDAENHRPLWLRTPDVEKIKQAIEKARQQGGEKENSAACRRIASADFRDR